MDETIGAKGGYNDRRRMLKISKLQKEKLEKKQEEKELKDLEKKVKKQQIYTLIKALPIAIGGGTFKILYDVGTAKKDIDKQDEYSKWRIKEYDTTMSTKSRQEEAYEKKMKQRKVVVIQPDGRKVVVLVPIEENKKIKDYPIVEDIKIEEKKKIEDKKKSEEKKKKNEEKKQLEEKKKEEIEIKNIEELKEKQEEKKKKQSVGISPEEIDDKVAVNINNNKKDKFKIEIPKIKIDENKDFDELSPRMKEELDKIKARKIIDEYEKQLKDIRYELRQLVYEYNVLEAENDKAITSKEIEDILARLSEVIWRVEELKNKIKIENLDKYDDNYIYTLIEDYLLEFKDKQVISEIKDSPLYVLIEEKLDELDQRKNDLDKRVKDKKYELIEKEEDFELLKEKYYKIDKINKELNDFQREQDALLKEIRYKIDNAVDVSERVQVEIEAMSRQSRRLLRRLTLAMMFPGTRAARGLSLTTAAYIYFARQLMNPRTVTRRYRVVNVSDYSRDIENSISSIDDAVNMLGKTDEQVDRLISQIKSEFGDYIGVIKECDELLSNLQKVKNDLSEKEYEMQKIKQAQELELERNNAKVLTRGEYQM